MEGTMAGVGIHGGDMADEDVAGFGMEHAVDGLSVDDDARADTGADGVIDQRVGVFGIAPDVLRERGAVDIRVKSAGQAEFTAQRTDEVRILPAGFGRGGDVSIRRGGGVRVNGTEGRGADGFQRIFPAHLTEKLHGAADRLFRRRGGETDFLKVMIRVGRDRTYEFRPARFQRSVIIHKLPSCPLLYPAKALHENGRSNWRSPCTNITDGFNKVLISA